MWGITADNVVAWTALAAGVGSALGQIYGARMQRDTLREMIKQSQNNTFDRFSEEYIAIKGRLPHGFRSRAVSEPLKDEHLIAAHEIVDLFAREHRYHESGRLHPDFWPDVLKGVHNFGLSPHGEVIWSQICQDPHCEYPDDFIVFMNKTLAQERTKRKEILARGYFPPIMQDNRTDKETV